MSYANDFYKTTKRVMEEQSKKYEFQRLISDLREFPKKGQFETFLDPVYLSNFKYKDAMLRLLEQEQFKITYFPEMATYMVSWREAGE